jgi:septal ring factor EnvC (AmiA/AmiB activator)
MKAISVDYIAKATKLNEEDRDRVLSRMGGKLPKRLQKEKLTVVEAIAIQLELEDEQLQEWRANMAVIQEKAAKAKLKAEEKAAKANKSKAEVVKAAPKAKASKSVAKKATEAKVTAPATKPGPLPPSANSIFEDFL